MISCYSFVQNVLWIELCPLNLCVEVLAIPIRLCVEIVPLKKVTEINELIMVGS